MDLREVKKTIEEFFEKLQKQAEIREIKMEEKKLSVKVKLEEGEIFGETLFTIQHLLCAILKKKFKEDFFLDLDINDYKKKKENYLRELAKTVADEVALTKKAKELEPMPAYERRIIHLELALRKDVVTKSIGEGKERRVVIYPYP